MRRLIALLVLVFPALVTAQPVDETGAVVGRIEGRMSSPGGGYYLNAREGEPTLRVSVLGQVARPGVYELGRGFDLASVLALAGMPTVAGERETGDPEVTVRMFRADGGRREAIYTASAEDFVTGAAGETPALREGDLVEVTTESAARVYVWGAVRTPGLFDVGPGLDMRAALALAGGPLLPPIEERVERTVTVRVYRPDSGGSEAFLTTTLEAFASGEVDLPEPQDGDTIIVEVTEKRGLTFRDVVSGVGAAAAVVTAVTLAVIRFDGN